MNNPVSGEEDVNYTGLKKPVKKNAFKLDRSKYSQRISSKIRISKNHKKDHRSKFRDSLKARSKILRPNLGL